MSETIGERLFKIRAACGSSREPETLDDFAERVRKKTGKSYNPVTLSLLERMKRGWHVVDVENFAAVDPKQRGPAWLAWGKETSAVDPKIGPALPEPVPMHQQGARRVRRGG